MSYSIDSNSIRTQVKVHTGNDKVKVVIRVVGQGQQSFFAEKKEVRIYTRTLLLDSDLRIKKIFEDVNGNCWMLDVSTAKRLADRFGRREGQKVVLVDTNDKEISDALNELERLIRGRRVPVAPRAPRVPRAPRTSRAGTTTGAVIGGILGGILGSAFDD